MKDLFFVKVTIYLSINRKESNYVNCHEIKTFGAFINTNKQMIYYVELYEEKNHSMCLHRIRKSDYERLKRL